MHSLPVGQNRSMEQSSGVSLEPRMPRSRRRPGENRAALLEAAVVEFGRHGYHGASTASIASRAQIPQPHVYVHFSTKSALFLAALEHSYMASDGPADPSRSGSAAQDHDGSDLDSALDAESLMHLQAIAAVADPGLAPEVSRMVGNRVRLLGQAWNRACLERAAGLLLAMGEEANLLR